MPCCASNDTIRVRELNKPGHVRVPDYPAPDGRAIHFFGVFLNPEDLAVGNTSGLVVERYRSNPSRTRSGTTMPGV